MGDWRGFSVFHFNNGLWVAEQCTKCGKYRARDAEENIKVAHGTSEEVEDIPDPSSGDGDGSVWADDV